MTVGGMGFIPERLLMMMMMMTYEMGTRNKINVLGRSPPPGVKPLATST